MLETEKKRDSLKLKHRKSHREREAMLHIKYILLIAHVNNDHSI